MRPSSTSARIAEQKTLPERNSAAAAEANCRLECAVDKHRRPFWRKVYCFFIYSIWEVKEWHYLKSLKNGALSVSGELLKKRLTRRMKQTKTAIPLLLQAHPEFSLEPFPVPDGLDLPNEGYAALLPHKHAADGFFICKLRKHA